MSRGRDRLLSQLARQRDALAPRVRRGQVTAVGAGVVSVVVAGSSVTVPDVPHLASYSPVVGDFVDIEVRGPVLRVIGSVA